MYSYENAIREAVRVDTGLDDNCDGKVRASVFLIHGMRDLNVRMKHVGQWWDAPAKNGVERRHRWFDHELLGHDNGIDREPMADIERPPTGGPPRRPGRRAAPMRPHCPAKGTEAGVGTVGLRLSGSSEVTVTATPTTSTAHRSEGITTLTDRTCWGASTTGDSACFKETRAKTAAVGHIVVNRGWADLGSHASDLKGAPLTPGKAYTVTVTVDLAATDHVVPAGHRLALIVAGTDKDLNDPPSTKPTLTPDLSRTKARVPLVGGAHAFARHGEFRLRSS